MIALQCLYPEVEVNIVFDSWQGNSSPNSFTKQVLRRLMVTFENVLLN